MTKKPIFDRFQILQRSPLDKSKFLNLKSKICKVLCPPKADRLSNKLFVD